MPVSISRISLLVAWLGLLAATTAPAGVAKTPSKGELTVCKFAGPGVEIGKRFRFTANGRSFRLAAKSKSKAGCTTLAFEPGATVRLRERLPANTRVAISAKPAAALVSSDAVKGAAVLRLRRGKTTVRYTNVVCDEAAEMNGVEPVIPKDATEVGPLVDVDIDRGPLSSVYPGVDTTTDDFYPLPCDPSIGGTLPPEVDDPPSQAEIDLKAELDKFENAEGPGILKALQQSPIAPPPVPTLPGGECLFKDGKTTKVVPCDSKLFLHNDQPFAGRDIIYVHGLALDHLKNRIGNYGPAFKQWPADASEFLNPAGYYRQFAEKYWAPHIEENLYDPFLPFGSAAGWQWTASDPVPKYQRKSNRYLVVAWSSNQTLEYAQHALLTQIQLAIASNTNVVTPPQYPKTDVRPFCSNGCMIVSHSAGSLATSTAMSRAIAGDFGPGGKQIAQRMRAHVSFEGAISGSRLASTGVAVGLLASGGGAPSGLCAVFGAWVGTPGGGCIGNTAFVANSILRDLMPFVAQGIWGSVVAGSPVPTLTVAGGHPVGNYGGATKWLLPGLDDGVVSMNAACGNPNPVFPGATPPSGATVTSNVKAFEMSKSLALLARATKNFISHKDLQAAPPGGAARYLAGGCTPYRSPTGMVMPISNAYSGTPYDTRKRYPNHYSMLQGSIDHSYDGGTDSHNPWPSTVNQPASTVRVYRNLLGPNVEETAAVTDSGAYKQFADGTYLLHPAFTNLHEVVRGKKITFKLFKKKKTIWIWKRTFHLLNKWEQKQSSHYVYEFVGRG